jgi:hypothetical protein
MIGWLWGPVIHPLIDIPVCLILGVYLFFNGYEIEGFSFAVIGIIDLLFFLARNGGS